MKQFPRSVLFLLLNILVTIATVAILWLAWIKPQQEALLKELGLPVGVNPGLNPSSAESIPTPTLPPLDQVVLEVKSVTGMEELSLETLVLERVGEGDVWLAGWQVTDEDGNLYQFPELLLQGGTIRLHSGAGRNTLPDLYWGLIAPVWESGETVTVIDSAGNVRTRAQLP